MRKIDYKFRTVPGALRMPISLVLLFSLLLLSACKKQLNVFPTTQEADGNVISDEKSAFTVLNGVYYRFVSGTGDYNGFPSTSWFRNKEQVPSQLSGLLETGSGNDQGLNSHRYNATDFQVANKWADCYSVINAANGFLKNIAPVNNISAAVKNRMIAEARFLRAYCNTELLLYFGQYNDVASPNGIILRNDFVKPSNVQLPRSSVATCYDSIISDLDAAIPALPSTASKIAYANVWTAKLLKARVLINRGAAADLAQVITLTKDITANSPFVLEDNVQDVFWTKGLDSKEVMMAAQPYDKQTLKWFSYMTLVDYKPSNFMDSLFQGDPRADWYLQVVETPYGLINLLTKYYPGPIVNFTPLPISENSFPFRLTEAYLLQAEAIAASGGDLSQAKALLKTVEGHAGITDLTEIDAAATGQALRQLIIVEEMKSFACEAGQDWFALRRLPFATIQRLLPTIQNKVLLILPIPDAEIQANSLIKQNVGY